MADTIDLFAILEYLDQRNLRLYDAVRDDDDARKDLEKNIGWLIPQWFTASTNDADHRDLILMFDMFCNPVWDSLYKHPELRTKLLACIGLDKKVRHKFFKPGKKGSTNRLEEILTQIHPDITRDEMGIWCRSLNHDDFVDTMGRLGFLPKEIDAITPEYEEMRRRKA